MTSRENDLYFQVSFNFKVILFMVKITHNNVTDVKEIFKALLLDIVYIE